MSPENHEPDILEEEEEGREWLITFADMMTLLLTFFVLIYTMSSYDKGRFDKILASIQYTLGASVSEGGYKGRVDLHQVREHNLGQVSGTEEEPLLKDLRQIKALKNLDDSVDVVQQGRQVIVRMKGQVLFSSGSSQFSPQSRAVLESLAKTLRQFQGYELAIKGHTDSRPIHSSRYASNWELSALRATAVLRFFVEQGIPPQRMTATGYADTEPLVPNTSQENMATNRRVEFVLEKK